MESEIQELLERRDLPEIREFIESFPNVWSTGIGYRIVDGKRTDTPAIIVNVKEKVDESDLEETEQIPDEINGIDIDVLETEIPTYDSVSDTRRNKIEPLIGGIRVARESGPGGTLTLGVRDSNGDPAILTCRHVVDDDLFDEGDDGSKLIGNPVYQPSTASSDNIIGEVTKASDWSGTIESDWAVVKLDDPNLFTNHVLGFGVPGSIREPSFDDLIVGSGITTGIGNTELVAVDVTVPISGTDVVGVYQYRNGDAKFSESGDSGKLVGVVDVDSEVLHPFGMHFAGGSSYGYAIPIQRTIDEANVSFDTGTYSIQGDGSDPHFEGTIVAADGHLVTVNVTNTGGSTGTASLDIVDGDGEILGRVHTTLGAFEHEYQTIQLTREVEDAAELKILFDKHWGEITTIGSGNVRVVEFSPDGEYLAATHNGNKQLALYTNGGRTKDWVRGVTFPSVDGTLIASATFSQDGSHIAYTAWGGEVYVYGPGTFGWEEKFSTVAEGSVYSSSFSPDGSLFAFGEGAGGNGEVHIYDTDDWSVVHTISDTSSTVETVGFSPNGNWFVYGTRGNSVRVYNVGDWSLAQGFSLADDCRGIAWSNDSGMLAMANMKHNIRVVDTNTWENITITGYGSEAPSGSSDRTLAFSHNDEYLAIASLDGEVYVINTDDWSLEQVCDTDGTSAFTVSWSPDDEYLAFGENAGGAKVLLTDQESSAVGGFSSPVTASTGPLEATFSVEVTLSPAVTASEASPTENIRGITEALSGAAVASGESSATTGTSETTAVSGATLIELVAEPGNAYASTDFFLVASAQPASAHSSASIPVIERDLVAEVGPIHVVSALERPASATNTLGSGSIVPTSSTISAPAGESGAISVVSATHSVSDALSADGFAASFAEGGQIEAESDSLGAIGFMEVLGVADEPTSVVAIPLEGDRKYFEAVQAGIVSASVTPIRAYKLITARRVRAGDLHTGLEVVNSKNSIDVQKRR
ncbi:hypothetical protein ACFQGT_09715 [Natrialbaceae archaeon GCM10025810]|uniref:hypothetical protein n=1 Tax=Halovalidus salilacus TaxID=3075124 RepID=UPI00361DDE1C